MNKERLIEVSLISIIVGGLAFPFVKERFLTNQDSLSDFITNIINLGDKIGTKTPSDTLNGLFSKQAERESITQYVTVESSTDSELAFVRYQFQSPFLPQGRLLDFRLLNDTFWFAGNTGLVGFDLTSEEWFVYNKKNGLPGDTVYDLEIVNDELLVQANNWNDNGSLSHAGNYRFKGERFNKIDGSLETAEAGVYLSSKLTGLPDGVNDIIKFDGFMWTSFRGKHINRNVGFQGGGVAKLTPEGQLVKAYTDSDGLSHSYSYSMTAMQDKSLWLSHFREERGLSVLLPNSSRWESIKKNINDIELGGVRLGSINTVLVIGQQRGLVFYDTISRQAYLMKESMGLPGYIVTGIQTVGETVWVSAYSYAKGGNEQRSTGLIKFEYQDIAALFQ